MRAGQPFLEEGNQRIHEEANLLEEMTEKERIYKTLGHQDTDLVPWHISFTIPAYKKMASYFEDRDFGERIGNHLAIIEPETEWREVKPDLWQDEFGVTWDKRMDKDIGNPIPVLENPTLKGYRFPDPYKKGRFGRYLECIDKNKNLFILSDLGFSLFERAWTLRGMENLLTDMVFHPEFVDDLLDHIVEYNLGIIKQALRFDIDGCRFGDDWGQQNGLIMGPKFWRQFIKPRIDGMYAAVHKAAKIVMIHSCGDVEEIFPDLIEVGVDIFNPFQPEVMDIFKMKESYGDRITFYGGVSIQKTLPYGTPKQVRKEIKTLLEKIGRKGGYILSPSHDTPGDVPVENILALMEVVQGQKKK